MKYLLLSTALFLLSSAVSAVSKDHPALRHRQLQTEEEDCDGCYINGFCYADGEVYTSPTCPPNDCTCNAANPDLSICTLMACEFPPEEDAVACPADVRQCDDPDGTYVSRVAPDCDFEPCPEGSSIIEPEEFEPEADDMGMVMCTMDVRQCNDPDGTYVGRVAPDCEFEPCPEGYTIIEEEEVEELDASGMMCPMDVKECADGTWVNRDPDNNCQFPECECACMNNGLCYKAGEQFQEECNTCTCGEDGLSACTAMACDCVNAGCAYGDTNYCFGESFLADDGCNTCSCSDNGAVACTLMLCPEELEPEVMPSSSDAEGCIWNGINHEIGAEYQEQCNKCTCATPVSKCTRMGCDCENAGCDVDGQFYCYGETFLDEDGCNTCTCLESGAASCTSMACIDDMTVTSEEVSKEDDCACEHNGLCYKVGDQYNLECNTCTCGANGSSCTKKGCDCANAGCEVEGKNYCYNESFLNIDGCNTCTCEESGAVSCTLKACIFETPKVNPEIEVSSAGEGEDSTSSASSRSYALAAAPFAFAVALAL